MEEPPGRVPGRPIAYAILVAVLGAAAFALLAGPASIGIGLVVVGAAIGRFVGLALQPIGRRPGMRGHAGAAAVGLTIGAIAAGELATWLYARAEGGVLSLPEYVVQVHGVLAPLALLLGGVVAWWSVRS